MPEERDLSKDSENGDGILQHKPFHFETNLQFMQQERGLDALNSGGGGHTAPEPNLQTARRVALQFEEIGTSADEVDRLERPPSPGSVIATLGFPLFYFENVRPVTPAPHMKCRSQQHGVCSMLFTGSLF